MSSLFADEAMGFEHANKIASNAQFERAVHAEGQEYDLGRRNSFDVDSSSGDSAFLRNSPSRDVESVDPFAPMASGGRARLGSVGADAGARGLLDDFEAEERQTDSPSGRRPTRAGRLAPAPTIEQEQAYQQQRFAESPYVHDKKQVSSGAAGNWAMHLWQGLNAKPVTRLPGMAQKRDPDEQAHMMQRLADNLNQFNGGDSIYASEIESPQQLSEQAKPTLPDNGDDRGMLDDFDAEFDADTPLTDANIDLPAHAPAGMSRRDSDYELKQHKGRTGLAEIPSRQPKTIAEERADQEQVYANTPYEDEQGRPLKNSDPRTRGRGEAPLPKKKSAMSRWWSGSKLNWNNWDWVKKRRARRARS